MHGSPYLTVSGLGLKLSGEALGFRVLGLKVWGLEVLGLRSPLLFRKDCDFWCRAFQGASWYPWGKVSFKLKPPSTLSSKA